MEKVESSGLLGQDGIVAYDWQIALGDDELSPAEFEHLSSLKVPLVKVRGQWVELKPEELAAALAFLQKKDTRKKKLGFDEALRLGLGGEDAALGLPVLGIEGEGWVKDLLEQLTNTAKLEPVPQPSTLQGTLRPYQLQGLAWLAFLRRFGLGACLADDMGLGKTIAYISLMLHERSLLPAGVKPAPSLLICPMSVVGNWQKELARFAPSLSAMVHHGPDRLSAKAFEREAQKHDLVLTTYALAQRDADDLSKIRWDCVVLDEAQNIKNQYAKQTQAIMQLDARSRIALTGTPVENRLSELWSIMQFLNPGYLGPSETFRKTYATPIERYRDEAKTAALKRMIQPFVLRRVKTDKSIIQDLPEKMEMKVYCNLTREQATLYEAVVKDMLEKIEQLEGIERRGLILVTMMKIKQICNHPAHFLKDESNLYGRSGKLARLEEMLEEAVQEGDKALVFTQFAEMGSLLRSHLQQVLGREVLFLHGGVPKMQRDMMIQRFQSERNGPPVFILSLKAGGFGLNLTAANHVFHFDRWWNPAVENQATDRAFRIGQTKNVQVHKFISIGTLEEKIDQLIEQKKELAQAVVGSGEGWVTELSTDQLRELFTLNRNAIGD
jgi:SNF2 family DNA or RNA helicase